MQVGNFHRGSFSGSQAREEPMVNNLSWISFNICCDGSSVSLIADQPDIGIEFVNGTIASIRK